MLTRSAHLDCLGRLHLRYLAGFLKKERRSPFDHFTKVATGVGAFGGGHFLRGSGDDKLTTSVTGLRADVDDPVGGLDDIEVMLDHDDAVALVDKSLEGLQQDGYVIDVESGGRFVEDEKRPAWLVSRQTCSQLEALGLTATQDIERLAKLQVVESDIGEELQRAADRI